MRTFLVELTARLQALGCVYVDRYNAQPEGPGGAPGSAQLVYDTPAVFVELLPQQWQSGGGAHLRTQLRLRLHVVQQRLDHSSQGGPHLASLDWTQQLARQLHGWRTPSGTELVLLETRFATAYTHLMADQLELAARLHLCDAAVPQP
jgi:hypothetical protein